MSYLVTGLDGQRVTDAPMFGMPAYSWRGVCRIGGCSSAAVDPHHVLPRARTGGPVRYVVIDGEVWANVLGLCRVHHNRLQLGESILEWHDPPDDPVGWWYHSAHRLVACRSFDQADAAVDRGGRCCPTCGQTRPRPRPYELHRRQRQPFTISAPVDQGEDGPAMLASMAEQVAEKIGMDKPASPSAAYHAVLTSLTAVLLHDDSLQGLRHHFHGEDR